MKKAFVRVALVVVSSLCESALHATVAHGDSDHYPTASGLDTVTEETHLPATRFATFAAWSGQYEDSLDGAGAYVHDADCVRDLRIDDQWSYFAD